MPKIHPIQTNFVQGELSPLMGGRYDLDMYGAGLKTLLNMYSDARGPAKSREGMKYMTQFNGSRCRIETIYRTDNSFYVLVFLNLVLHVITDIDSPKLETLIAPWTEDQIGDLQLVPYPINKTTYILHPDVQTQKLKNITSVTPDKIFLLDGTFDIPVGITEVVVCSSGGGGGGGSTESVNYGCGGGGGSGVVKEAITVTPGETVIAVIGAGGSASPFGGDGGPGGNSTLTYLLGAVTSYGGQGGSTGNSGGAPAAGGSGGSGGGDGGDGAPLGGNGKDGDSCFAVCSGSSNDGGDSGDGIDGGGGGGGGGWGEGGDGGDPGNSGMSGLDNTGGGGGGMGRSGTAIAGGNGGSGKIALTWGNLDGDFTLSAVTFINKPASWAGTNWPRSGVKHQGRLWLGGAPSDPEEFWGSKSNDPENFNLGTAQPDEAIRHSIDEAGQIMWMKATKSLVMGTLNNEFSIVADSGLLKPGDLEAKRQSSYGSLSISPSVIGDQIMYTNANARKIRSINYEWKQDNWQSTDLTFPSEHITKGLIKQLAWCQDPNNLLWIVLQDGALCCMTYERGANVYGWHRHETQGEVLSIASGSDGQRDILILAVLRRKRVLIGWDVSTAVYLQNFDIETEDNNPRGLFFKPSGLKMYMVGRNGHNIYEYDLSTAWSISTAIYLQSFNINVQDTAAEGLFFKPDGLKMYMIGSISENVFEYDLGTAWDVSTAVYLQFFNTTSEDVDPRDIFFSPDGLKMYTVGITNDDVFEYDLGTAWDVSTAVYLQLFNVNSEETDPTGIFFKPDGLKMYVIGTLSDNVNEYNLNIAWDISTAVYLQSFSVNGEDGISTGIFFKPDGIKMYMIGTGTNHVYEYDILAFALQGNSINIEYLSFDYNFDSYRVELVIIQYEDLWYAKGYDHLEGRTVQVLTDGTYYGEVVVGAESKAGAADGVLGRIYLDLTSPPDISTDAWDVSTAVYLQSFAVNSEDIGPMGIVFSPDGIKMYMIGSTGSNIYEYDLGTAWDISSIVYLQSFDISGEETSARGLFFKPDGLKVYIIGLDSDSVHEYDLGTAWDISTAVYLQSFSVNSEDIEPFDMFFSSDGLKMYMIGINNGSVNEYDLGTAWDISTAVYLQLFNVSGEETFPTGMFFKFDGLKMYVIGYSSIGYINEYDLGTAWDVTSATWNSNFNVSAQNAAPQGLFFKPDGGKMYMVGASAISSIYEYDPGYNKIVAAGLGYLSEMELLDMDGGAPTGSAAIMKKRWNKVYVKVLDSGPPLINGDRISDVQGDNPMDTTPPLLSGQIKDIGLDWDREGTINISQDLPLPLIVLAIQGELAKNAF